MPVEEISYTSGRTLRALFAAQGGAIRKSLGQNFLIDPTSTRRIAAVVRELGAEFSTWIEIGPGAGALTAELLLENKVIAIEIDPVAIRILRGRFPEQIAGGRLQIEEGDARELMHRDWGPAMGCGNLPYYISTELLLAGLAAFDSSVFLFQRDFARRLMENDSSLGIYVGNLATCQEHFRLSPAVFYPRPTVDSLLVSLKRRPRPFCPPAILERLLRASFLARRKKIANSWRISGQASEQWFFAAGRLGLDLSMRADEIPAGKYYELAAAIAH
ncbi:MAG: hypothetical protein HS115_08845 [Spirochaetales bacterium]|nr:hypothetical protein [Spirochaetales bacterium]